MRAAVLTVLLGTPLLAACAEPIPARDLPAVPAVDGYPYPGYPKVVELAEVPSAGRTEIDTEIVLVVAPSVWTAFVEGDSVMDSVMEAVKNGKYVGRCAAVAEAHKRLGHDGDTVCW